MNTYCHFKFHDWSWVSLEHGLHQKFKFLLIVLDWYWERRPLHLQLVEMHEQFWALIWIVLEIFSFIYQLWIANIINSSFGNKVEYHLINDLTKHFIFLVLCCQATLLRETTLSTPSHPHKLKLSGRGIYGQRYVALLWALPTPQAIWGRWIWSGIVSFNKHVKIVISSLESNLSPTRMSL